MKFLQIAALAGAAAAVSLMEVSEDEKAGLRELAGEFDFDLDKYMADEGKSWDDVKREAKEEAGDEFDSAGDLKRAKKPKKGGKKPKGDKPKGDKPAPKEEAEEDKKKPKLPKKKAEEGSDEEGKPAK